MSFTTMEELEDGAIRAIYDDDEVCDITDKVTEYEKGKTFECECGQGFGVDFEVTSIICPNCGKTVIDRDYDSRSPPVRDNSQAALTDW